MSATGVLVERDAQLRVLERALEVVEVGRSRAVGIVRRHIASCAKTWGVEDSRIHSRRTARTDPANR